MTQYWEPGTQYNLNDVVEYEGHHYKIIQPHRSQSDWTPDITPALWGKLQGHHHGREHHEHGREQQQQQQQQQWNAPQPPQSSGYDYGKQEQGPHNSAPSLNEDDKQKHWFDLTDERKHELEVGGGLAAAAGLLAGGYFAYKHHEKSEEAKKADVFGLQKWLDNAKGRTDLYFRSGPAGPATWILNQGKSIPPGAIETGQEHDWTLYICRAYQDGSVQPGKASNVFQKGAVIGYRNEEIQLDTYEILVGDMRGLRWVEARGHLHVASLGCTPVEGGYENDGTQLYIAKAHHKDAWHPGKASEKLDGAYIPYDGKEKQVKEYQVLCYNN